MTKKQHFYQYLILGLVFCAGALGFWRFQVSPKLQFLDVLLTVFGYWIWGLVHHYQEHRLRAEVVVEYLLVGFTVLALFSLVIFQR